ncbi:hypothetical protein CMO92_00585 [Candidatus Woesearchaeota archaeon]|nr:hypothetical protein [Candidatus Woesearchaeota archaeon]
MILNILILALILFISALPLYLAVTLLGGKATIIKVLIVEFITTIALIILQFILPKWGFIVGFLLLLYIYREMFRLKWWKTILAWLLKGVIVFLLILLLLGATFLL